MLGLGDRHIENIIFTREQRIVNIDFGCLFYFGSRFTPVYDGLPRSGRNVTLAKELVKENLEKNLDKIVAICKKMHKRQLTSQIPLEHIKNYCKREGWNIGL